MKNKDLWKQDIEAMSIMNKKIDELYKTIEAKDKIINEQALEIARLKKIAHKMHLYIFLHTDNEQKVYDELGLTDEENAMLGYSGQFILGDKENE